MSEADTGRWASSLAARVAALLLRPRRTWDEIAAAPQPAPDLYRRYVAPLAAVPAVCGALGLLLFGTDIFGQKLVRQPALVLAEMAVDFLLTLVEVYLLTRIIQALAPAFGGVRDGLRAFNLAAFSGTALWVTGVFGLYPDLGWLAAILGGLYSLYLLFLGLPRLMGVGREHQLTAFATIFLALMVMAAIHSTLTAMLLDSGGLVRVASLQTWPT